MHLCRKKEMHHFRMGKGKGVLLEVIRKEDGRTIRLRKGGDGERETV